MTEARYRGPRRPALTLGATFTLLAAIPAFGSARGVVPADSKLGLYLDPGRLLSDARWSWDRRLFGGWVPHQQIGFAWPSGPWFWLGDRLGLPDWVVHRLWITALLVAAAAGVAWCARRLGLSWTAAALAGAIYELSPYLLAYVSRTSVMLLPWAGLGWIVGLTVLASSTRRWREPALIALVVTTVGGVNATALAMIAPGPVLWLVHAVWSGIIGLRAAVTVALRTALLAVGTSLWWLAMLIVQQRAGAPVLEFSETLADVSSTATAPEVLRGLGYWLFYVRDALHATTAASLPHLGRTLIVGLNFALVVIGFAAIATLRWSHRRFAAMLIGAGAILGVGVHPLEQPSPLMSLLLGDDPESGVGLALRSSTRAVPLLILGLALAIGAAASLRVDWRHHPRRTGALVVGSLALLTLNLPAWWTGGFVDPGLTRSDPPVAWYEAADLLDSRPDDRRILQIPGSEFGVFRWGHTNDHPLPSLTDRPVLTRDLLPLGNAALMDLAYALDDRVHEQILEPSAVAPVARLLGIDTIWLSNDLAHERYLSAPPEPLTDLLASAPGLTSGWASGDRIVNRAEPPRLDERTLSDTRVGAPVPSVQLIEVVDPLPIARIGGDVVAFIGSGDGVLDAAAAGLIDGSEVLLTREADVPTGVVVDRLIVTDSNRARPHHWRGSQDVVGATESADPALRVPDRAVGDRRLIDPVAPTTAEQIGPIRATASDYGPPLAYQPEYRPAMAIDGIAETAWLVGGEAHGEMLRLLVDGDAVFDELTLLQPPDTLRIITGLRLSVESDDRVASTTVPLTDASLNAPGQTIALPAPAADGTTIDLEIVSVSERDPSSMTTSPTIDAVGLAEVHTGLPGTREVVTLPAADWSTVDQIPADQSVVLTRLRTDPMRRERRDPEYELFRDVTFPAGRTVSVRAEVGIDPRATDEELTALLGGRAVATQHLAGVPAARASAAFDRSSATAWISPFAPAGPLTITVDLAGPTDQLVIEQPDTLTSPITELTVHDTTTGARAAVALDTADRIHRIDLPTPIGPGAVEIEVTGFDSRSVFDHRTQRPVVLPVAIAEIDLDVAVVERPAADSPECRDDLLSVDGQPIPVTVTLPAATAAGETPLAVVDVCEASIDLGPGAHRIEGRRAGALTVDRVVLESAQPERSAVGDASVSASRSGRVDRHLEVTGCRLGCWLVIAEGHHDEWAASLDDVAIGPATELAGGIMGWYLPPGGDDAESREITLVWGPQRVLDVAWLLTAFSVVVCLVLVIASRGAAGAVPVRWRPRRTSSATAARPLRSEHLGVTSVAMLTVGAALLVGPVWGAAGLALGVGTAVLGHHRARILEWFATAAIALVAAGVLITNRLDRPPPNFDWPSAFSAFHGVTMFAVVVLVVATLSGSDDVEPADSPPAEPVRDGRI